MGRLVAEYSDVAGSDCATCYLFGDHLGSTRMVADAGGAVRKRFDFMPFGVEIKLGSGFASSNGRSAEHESGTPVTLQFTGAYRDGAAGEVPVDFMESIVGSIFKASYQTAGARIIPSIQGFAYVNMEATLLFSPSDPFAMGIRR